MEENGKYLVFALCKGRLAFKTLELLEKQIISNSKFWDASWYIKKYGHQFNLVEALDYWYKIGWKRGESPSQYINVKYCGKACGGVNPIIAYLDNSKIEYLNIIRNKNTKMSISIKKADHTPANIILIIINIVFILFLISEISKITINFLHIPVQYTYANYAREGFFQLLIVTTINFSIIAYYLYYTNIIKENKLIPGIKHI